MSMSWMCLILAGLGFSLLLAQPARSFNGIELAAELSVLPEEDCMSTPQLQEVLREAAYNSSHISNAVWTPRSTVMLTSCDLRVRACMHACMSQCGLGAMLPCVVPVPVVGREWGWCEASKTTPGDESEWHPPGCGRYDAPIACPTWGLEGLE